MKQRNDVSPEAVHSVVSNVKTQTRRKLPYDTLDPNARRDKAFRFETNAWERAVFKYLAMVRGKEETMADVIRKFAREAALRELGKVDAPPPSQEAG